MYTKQIIHIYNMLPQTYPLNSVKMSTGTAANQARQSAFSLGGRFRRTPVIVFRKR